MSIQYSVAIKKKVKKETEILVPLYNPLFAQALIIGHSSGSLLLKPYSRSGKGWIRLRNSYHEGKSLITRKETGDGWLWWSAKPGAAERELEEVELVFVSSTSTTVEHQMKTESQTRLFFTENLSSFRVPCCGFASSVRTSLCWFKSSSIEGQICEKELCWALLNTQKPHIDHSLTELEVTACWQIHIEGNTVYAYGLP